MGSILHTIQVITGGLQTTVLGGVLMSVAATALPVTVDMNMATLCGGPVDPNNLGYITSLFGPREPLLDPDTGYWTSSFHYGLDVAYAPWQVGVVPLCAMFAGTVVLVDYNATGGGHFIRVRSDDGSTYFEYAHMAYASPFVVGDRVCAGTRVGYVGSTGLSTGPHVHLGLIYYGQYIDPLPYMFGIRDVGEDIPGSNYFDECGQYHDEWGYFSG